MALATRGPITPAMRVALGGSLVLFSGTVLVPALLVLWTTAMAVDRRPWASSSRQIRDTRVASA